MNSWVHKILDYTWFSLCFSVNHVLGLRQPPKTSLTHYKATITLFIPRPNNQIPAQNPNKTILSLIEITCDFGPITKELVGILDLDQKP